MVILLIILKYADNFFSREAHIKIEICCNIPGAVITMLIFWPELFFRFLISCTPERITLWNTGAWWSTLSRYSSRNIPKKDRNTYLSAVLSTSSIIKITPLGDCLQREDIRSLQSPIRNWIFINTLKIMAFSRYSLFKALWKLIHNPPAKDCKEEKYSSFPSKLIWIMIYCSWRACCKSLRVGFFRTVWLDLL